MVVDGAVLRFTLYLIPVVDSQLYVIKSTPIQMTI